MPLQECLPLTAGTRQWPVWGTTARIVLTDAALADRAQRLVSGYLERVDTACSRFRPDSELASVQALCSQRPGVLMPVSPLLAELIEAALDAASRTAGDVDPTLADDLCALGYDQDFGRVQLGTGAGPIGVRLVHRVRHDWRDVQLELGDRTRVAMSAGMHLDLGSSAKAFAADRCAALVADTLGGGVLVALGGDIALAGEVPADGWQILVQDGAGEPASTVSLFSGGMATSSTLSRNWRHGTRQVHHILDPGTGQPAEPVWRTVSVVAGTCAQANMMATASIVRGWKAVALLRDTGLAARAVGRSGDLLRLGDWPLDSWGRAA